MPSRKGPGGRRKGAGRPPLDPADARTEVVRVRLTPGEGAAARELAEREQLSISEFGRAAIQLAIARGSTR